MPELSAILKSSRDKEHENRKFIAAVQGIDLDASSGVQEDPWEKLKAKVASGGKATDSKDILGLQGKAAEKAGFGIGYGIEFEDLTTTATAETGGDK